jgi:hypothetical protein
VVGEVWAKKSALPAVPSAQEKDSMKTDAKGNDRTKAVKQSQQALEKAGLTVPKDWQPAQARRAPRGPPVTVVRCEQGTTRDLGGQHITTVVETRGLLGRIWSWSGFVLSGWRGLIE